MAEELKPLCDCCNSAIEYDLIIPDDVWATICPRPLDGWKSGGLLCPSCIVSAIATPDPELTTLRARVKELEEGLGPFATYETPDGVGDEFLRFPDAHPVLINGEYPDLRTAVTVGDLRRARTLLKGAAS